ncbi:hypothetical protein Nmel_009186 [Mimus melanotis]
MLQACSREIYRELPGDLPVQATSTVTTTSSTSTAPEVASGAK